MSDYIRGELSRNIDAITDDVVDKLASKGVEVERALVYKVRSQLRKEQEEVERKTSKRMNAAALTRRDNPRTLSCYIVDALYENDEPGSNPEPVLTDRQITAKIKESGYITRAADFLNTVRQKLYDLLDERRIVRTINGYNLSQKEFDKQTEERALKDPDYIQYIQDQQCAKVATASPSLHQTVSPVMDAVKTAAFPGYATKITEVLDKLPAGTPEFPQQTQSLVKETLLEVAALLKKVGGVNGLKPYLEVINQLSN